MDPNYSEPEALAVLSSTINQTLIETGRFFRSKSSMQSRAQLKRTLPASREQFNLALDDLSEQVFMAKAFLERDYEAIRARKAASQQPAEDVVMGEAEIKPEPEPEPEGEKKPEPELEAEPELKPPVPEAAGVKQEEDYGKAVKAEAKPNVQEKEEEEEEEVVKPPADEKPRQTRTQPEEVDLTEPIHRTGGEPTEINFDSVLNDNAGGPNDFDLSLDFGDDLGNQNFLGVGGGSGGEEQGKGTPQNMDMAGEVRGERGTGTTGELGGDAFDMELQKSGSSDGLAGQDEGGAGEMMMGQSSFDDLFMEHESMEGNLLEGDGLMNLNELDDSWFT